MKSAEVYDVVKTRGSVYLICQTQNRESHVSGYRIKFSSAVWGFRLVSYDVRDQIYSYVGLKSNSVANRSIAFSKDKIYICFKLRRSLK